jgi:hypothetical protein
MVSEAAMSPTAIVFALWSTLGFAKAPDAPTIASAIEKAIGEEKTPVWDAEHTAAVMGYWAAKESGVRINAHSDVDVEAYGIFQLHGAAGKGAPLEQARAWLRLLHAGARICPAHPLAPLSGSCNLAWRLADRRAKAAWRLADLAI